jgi:hypothetical protein
VWLKENIPKVPDVAMTPMRQAMPDPYKNADPVKAYQTYYIQDKARMLTYTRRERPEFIS